MPPDKVINVREVLNQNSYTTTVDELRNRGKSRVRVINAEQISALIEEAVNRVISTSAGMDRGEVKKIVQRSREEFRRLLSEREKELKDHREAEKGLEIAAKELDGTRKENERLQVVEGELRKQNEMLTTQIGELKVSLEKASSGENAASVKELEKLQGAKAEMEKTISDLKDEVASMRQTEKELRKAESDARSGGQKEIDAARKQEEKAAKEVEKLQEKLDSVQATVDGFKEKEAELRGELKAAKEEVKAAKEEAKTAAEAAPAKAEMSPEVLGLIKGLVTEVASVKNDLKEATLKSKEEVQAPSAAEAAASKAVADRMEEITKGMSDRLDQIGRKVGLSSAIDVEATGLEKIFETQGDVESNLDNVEVKERKGKGIGGALERMKKLRKKGKK